MIPAVYDTQMICLVKDVDLKFISHLCSILQMWLERPVNFVLFHNFVVAVGMRLGLVPTYAEQENAEDEN